MSSWSCSPIFQAVVKAEYIATEEALNCTGSNASVRVFVAFVESKGIPRRLLTIVGASELILTAKLLIALARLPVNLQTSSRYGSIHVSPFCETDPSLLLVLIASAPLIVGVYEKLFSRQDCIRVNSIKAIENTGPRIVGAKCATESGIIARQSVFISHKRTTAGLSTGSIVFKNSVDNVRA